MASMRLTDCLSSVDINMNDVTMTCTRRSRKDGWMDGWMDGRMDGWMEGWMYADVLLKDAH